MRTSATSCLILALVFWAPACAGTATQVGPESDGSRGTGGLKAATLLDGDWRLVEWVDSHRPVQDKALPPITLAILGESLSGAGICNAYRATAQINGSTMHITKPHSTTDKWCQHYDIWLEDSWVLREDTAAVTFGERNTPKDPYLEALTRVDAYERKGKRLVLTGQGIRLAYEQRAPAPDAPLPETLWVLQTVLSEPRQGNSDTLAEDIPTEENQKPTLLLKKDGRFMAHTGCREITGTWEHDSDRIRFRDTKARDTMCREPHLQNLEKFQLQMLASTLKVKIAGRTLHLWTEDGRGLGYTTEADPSDHP